jgi:hypothetical protein
MSTLKADTIQNTSGGAATLTKQEAAKMYSRVNISANTVTKSLNLSSTTNYGTGSDDLNFTNSFSDALYSLSGNHNGVSGNSASTVYGHDNSGLMTSSKVNVVCFMGSGRTDATECSTQIFGDLA